MTGPAVVPYGEWPSRVTAELVTASAASLGSVAVGDGQLWWDESRPDEGGRVVVVRSRAGGTPTDVLPPGYAARTRVHEYGGGAWWLHDDVLYFANWDDQRLYRLDPGQQPWALTPAPPARHSRRYADGRLTADARWVVCVEERHPDDGTDDAAAVVNRLVAVDAHGPDRPSFATPQPGTPAAAAGEEVVAAPPDEPTVLVAGPDFVSSPRPSSDGRSLAWVQWDHPRMPWDGAELWVADLETGPDGVAVHRPRRVAGGPDEAVTQPAWAPDGSLWFASDADGWWNLYRLAPEAVGPSAADGDGVPQAEAVTRLEGEVGTPAWVFGASRYAVLRDDRVLLAFQADGVDHLAVLDADRVRPPAMLATPYTALSGLVAYGDGAAFLAAGPRQEPAVVVLDVDDGADRPPALAEVRPPRSLDLAPSWYSVPQHITFPSAGDRVAHALWYPPTNPDVVAPPGELPPVLVLIHGGPTSAARPQLNLAVQYWTSRGVGVVDVNYAGSTGYGRPYRRALEGCWGIADVEDCAAAVHHLVATGRADPARLLIRGGSAGGFTALCALLADDTFAAGASLYGVTDLEALARDTHKFEARYLDSLVGPYPETRDTYVARSPIHRVDELDRPLIVFQGLEDAVVPPSQAEALVAALEARGVAHAYVAFPDEQHGFRRAANIQRVLVEELAFYGRVLGFSPAG